MLQLIKDKQVKIAVMAFLLILPLLLMLMNAQNLLRYHSFETIDHEYWRWLSGHWVHLTWGHLWMNWLALLILMVSFFDNLKAKTCITMSIGLPLLISLAFIVFSPELVWYVGLSGMLHGVFVLLVLQDSKLSAWLKAVFLTSLAAKLIWEQIYGAMPGSAELAGGNVVVDSHLYGALSALLYLLIALIYDKWQESRGLAR